MSKSIEVGSVDYDYDQYNNRLRKYVCTGFEGIGRDRQSCWKQVEEFKPEKGMNNIPRSNQ